MFPKMGFRISCIRPDNQRKNSLRKAHNESQTSLILLRGRGFVVETLILFIFCVEVKTSLNYNYKTKFGLIQVYARVMSWNGQSIF